MAGKVDLTPRRHHGFAVILFILGTLFPPLAVAARFGIGGDFWLNLLLTICGYIPGHVHNFYIQNIRNNKNHARTPKWAQRYGLVDTTKIKRNERKSQWASRYNERLPHSTLQNQPYEEGQEQGSSIDVSLEGHGARPQRQTNGELWRPEDEQYYGVDGRESTASSSGRWHYPANFDDAAPPSGGSKKGKKKKEKKDRWERTDDAYSISEERQRKKSKRKKKVSSVDTGSMNSTTEYPEAAEGGLYGDTPRIPSEAAANGNSENLFDHQF